MFIGLIWYLERAWCNCLPCHCSCFKCKYLYIYKYIYIKQCFLTFPFLCMIICKAANTWGKLSFCILKIGIMSKPNRLRKVNEEKFKDKIVVRSNKHEFGWLLNIWLDVTGFSEVRRLGEEKKKKLPRRSHVFY